MRDKIAQIIYEWNTGFKDFSCLRAEWKNPYLEVADQIMDGIWPNLIEMKNTVEQLKADAVERKEKYIELEQKVKDAITLAGLQRMFREIF